MAIQYQVAHFRFERFGKYRKHFYSHEWLSLEDAIKLRDERRAMGNYAYVVSEAFVQIFLTPGASAIPLNVYLEHRLSGIKKMLIDNFILVNRPYGKEIFKDESW